MTDHPIFIAVVMLVLFGIGPMAYVAGASDVIEVREFEQSYCDAKVGDVRAKLQRCEGAIEVIEAQRFSCPPVDAYHMCLGALDMCKSTLGLGVTDE